MAGASPTPGESFVRNRAVPPFVLNSQGTRLAADGVLVRQTPSGYVCLGLGSGAAAMRVAFAGADEGRLAKLGGSDGGVRAPTMLSDVLDDPNLRRLALLEALLKDGYDPDQPRDERGRWTDGGGGSGVAAGSVADVAVPAAGAGLGDLVGAAASRLATVSVPRALAMASGVGAFATTMLWPAGNAAVHEGTIAGQPEIGYRYDEGALTLWRQKPDGTGETLYSGIPSPDGAYRDEEGHVIGHSVGDTFAVDGAVLPALSAKANSKAKPHLDAKARSLARTSEPEVCPDPGPDWPGNRIERAMAYQRQIARLPDGPDGRPMVAWYHGMAYDGCDLVNGNLLEAKEGGYANFIDRNGKAKEWASKSKKGLNEAMEQMVLQSRAAPDRTIEWHFSEPTAAAFFAKYAEGIPLKNIVVIHTPAITG